MIGRRKRHKISQTFVEYAMLIAIATGALLLMHNYLNRSLQGRLKAEVDRLNPEGDYTLIDGQGRRSRTRTGFVYEGRKGHQISWRSSWLNERFAFNAANQIPPLAWQQCEGAECDFLLVQAHIGNSDLGRAAVDYINCPSDDPSACSAPLGDHGIASDVQNPADLSALATEADKSDKVQRHNIQGVIDPNSIDPDNPSSYTPVVEAQSDYVKQKGSAPNWAYPLLDLR